MTGLLIKSVIFKVFRELLLLRFVGVLLNSLILKSLPFMMHILYRYEGCNTWKLKVLRFNSQILFLVFVVPGVKSLFCSCNVQYYS